jgi:hypothetical protein
MSILIVVEPVHVICDQCGKNEAIVICDGCGWRLCGRCSIEVAGPDDSAFCEDEDGCRWRQRATDAEIENCHPADL